MGKLWVTATLIYESYFHCYASCTNCLWWCKSSQSASPLADTGAFAAKTPGNLSSSVPWQEESWHVGFYPDFPERIAPWHGKRTIKDWKSGEIPVRCGENPEWVQWNSWMAADSFCTATFCMLHFTKRKRNSLTSSLLACDLAWTLTCFQLLWHTSKDHHRPQSRPAIYLSKSKKHFSCQMLAQRVGSNCYWWRWE